MNFHLKRHRKLSEVISIPEGLPELMADITREVLRYQPANIEEFIADYLEAMVLTRELYYVSEKTVDDILNQSIHLQEMMKNTGVSITQSNAAIQMVMDSVKKHRNFIQKSEGIKELDFVNRLIKELNFTVEQAKKASDIIENVWCHYYNHNKNYVLKFKTKITDNEAIQHTLSLHHRSDDDDNGLSGKDCVKLKDYFLHKKSPPDDFHEKYEKAIWKNPNFTNRENAANMIKNWYKNVKTGKSPDEDNSNQLNSAASKIQAGFKGFKTRKELSKSNKSATLIQALYRGYLARKKLKDAQ